MSFSSQQQTIPRIYTLPEIESAISSPQFAIKLIDAIRKGFIAYSRGEFNACPIQTMGAPPMAPFCDNEVVDDAENKTTHSYSAQTCVKSGYLTSSSHYVIKVASGGHPFPANSGLMQLYSQRTGKLETILLDEGLLTELRTAAVGAVAAQMLAPADLLLNSSNSTSSSCCWIGMVGTGVQARFQLRYLGYITECRNVMVWGRSTNNVQQFIADMEKEGWNVDAVDDVQELLNGCNLIVTTTSSRAPLLKLNSTTADGGSADAKITTKPVRRPLHINAIGSDSTGKMELDPDLIASADLLVADSRIQTKERGEYEEALARGLISLDDIIELGELADQTELHRKKKNAQDDFRFTIFDSSGVAVQDCVIAAMVNDFLLSKEK
ncbi:hypothetical protein ACHAXR_005687 [Thalassiosira sp. AJA248-18]